MSEFKDDAMDEKIVPPSGEDQAAAARTLRKSALRLRVQEAEEALGIEGAVWLGDLAGFTVAAGGIETASLLLRHHCGWSQRVDRYGRQPYLADLVVTARTHEKCAEVS